MVSTRPPTLGDRLDVKILRSLCVLFSRTDVGLLIIINIVINIFIIIKFQCYFHFFIISYRVFNHDSE